LESDEEKDPNQQVK